MTVRNMRFANFYDVLCLILMLFYLFFILSMVWNDQSTLFEIDKSKNLEIRRKRKMKFIRKERQLYIIILSCFVYHSTSFLLGIGNVLYDMIGPYLLFFKWFNRAEICLITYCKSQFLFYYAIYLIPFLIEDFWHSIKLFKGYWIILWVKLRVNINKIVFVIITKWFIYELFKLLYK